MEYLHTNDVCHRDLKLDNLLLDSNFNLKVTDFGFASDFKQFGGYFDTVKGSNGYMSPEMFSAKPYNGVYADIFAMGVILFAMKLGIPPFLAGDMSFSFYA